MTEQHPDSDIHKGAVEDDGVTRHGERRDPAETNTTMSGQIGHRSPATGIGGQGEGEDTDFPEPGETGEHSGQHK